MDKIKTIILKNIDKIKLSLVSGFVVLFLTKEQNYQNSLYAIIAGVLLFVLYLKSDKKEVTTILFISIITGCFIIIIDKLISILF